MTMHKLDALAFRIQHYVTYTVILKFPKHSTNIHLPASTVSIWHSIRNQSIVHTPLSASLLCPVSSGSAAGSDCAEANTKSCCCISPLEVWIPQYRSVCFVSICAAVYSIYLCRPHETHHCCRCSLCCSVPFERSVILRQAPCLSQHPGSICFAILT